MSTTMAVRQLPKLLDPVVLPTPSSILTAVREASRQVGRTHPPRLVAVSKQQPVEKIQAAYEEGLRHFGESYPQELLLKSKYLQRLGQYDSIRWHFIGHVQRRKEKLLANIPGLWMVESIDGMRCANLLNKQWGYKDERLRVLVQVNTSGEEGKHGCRPEECADLAQCIIETCPNLLFSGLMTIGRFGHCHQTQGPNPDFQTLLQCGHKVKAALPLPVGMELSFGMSADYEHAIEMGSTNVRIGTAVFGSRCKA